jgi:hypothetical protein
MQIEEENHTWEECLCYTNNSDDGRGACRLGCNESDEDEHIQKSFARVPNLPGIQERKQHISSQDANLVSEGEEGSNTTA